jgi:outer membrane protein assembly factor BamB
MAGRLDLRRWIQVYQTAYAVAQSGDGRYVVVGTEKGAALFNLSGHRMVEYPLEGGELPIHRLCASLDLGSLVLATRLGEVLYLDLEATDGRFQIEEEVSLYSTRSDIHSLTFSTVSERVAIGHLSFALTSLNLEGEVEWQQQDQGAAALASTWSVDLGPQGKLLYAGSAGGGTNWLVALNSGDGRMRAQRECERPITAVAALPDGLGVVVIMPGEYYTARIAAYDASLKELLWEQELEGPATAMAADSIEPLLVVGAGYEGYVHLMSAATGTLLASEPLRAMVNGLSLTRGKFVAAATQDGNVALLRYLP